MATSAGKTLVVYLTLAYLLKHNIIKKAIMIVPRIGLVIQGFNDFIDYNYNKKLNLKMQQVYSGQEHSDDSNLVIGTYHSLTKLDAKYFEQFDCVFIDEVHLVNKSTIEILKKLEHCQFKFGLTGTLPNPEFADYLTIMRYTGPILCDVSSDFLIKNEPIGPSILNKSFSFASSNQ
jgi:replicative superfamily II helicase